MLNYTDPPSTPKVHLPRPGTTISSYRSSLASALTRRRVHRWGDRPIFLICLPAASQCTSLWGVVPRIPVPPQPRDITTPLPSHVSLSPPWSAWTPSGGIPPGPLASNLSPHKSYCPTLAPTAIPIYKSYHGPAPLLPYLSTPSRSSPTASALSSDFDTLPSNQCCYRRYTSKGKGRPPTVAGPMHWSGTRPY